MTDAVLAADRVTVSYGGIAAIRDVTIEVNRGEIVALLGANGAGKTTTLLTLAGELIPDAGTVRWLGLASKAPLHKRARQGLAYVADDRSVLMDLSAKDNLRVAKCDIAAAIELAPELEAHLGRRVGLLSGGQQQILSLARALARKPVVLLTDELSLGLAPLVVERLLATIRTAADQGLGVLLVEQHVRRALEIADRVYVLRNGTVEFCGNAEEARREVANIGAAYLGANQASNNHVTAAGRQI